MSLYRTYENLQTGESQGEFHSLKVRDSNGIMQDVIQLISGGGGGGSGVSDVTSASSELTVSTSGTTKQLALNLSAYATTAALATYLTQAALNTALASYSLTSSLTEALKLGVSDVSHSNLTFTCEALELHAHNNVNLKSRLEINNSGDLEE